MLSKDIKNSLRSRTNNAQGHCFESIIDAGCLYYRNSNIGEIGKTPEPFRVMKKDYRTGIFTGRFTTDMAQPDYKGTLQGGRSICFEAKHTSMDKIQRRVLSDNQMELLERHHNLGAITGVCVCIQDKYYFVPWEVWRDMKSIYGRQYLKPEDIVKYEIIFDMKLRFLDYKRGGNVWEERKPRKSINSLK